MAKTKQLIIELPTEIADQLEQKAAEAKLPLQVIVGGQLIRWVLGNHQIGYALRTRWAKAGMPSDRAITLGAGALAAEAAELNAQRHLEEHVRAECQHRRPAVELLPGRGGPRLP